MRKEKDSLGEFEVPAHAYWGVQTQRARTHFCAAPPIPPVLIQCYGHIKKAAACVNAQLAMLDEQRSGWIAEAADEVIQGKHNDQFPLGIWQSGSGTQTNMNVNEVIANRANEIAGGQRGAYEPVHPNDHVNHGQSTNDTFPTAMALACIVRSRALHKEVTRVSKDLRQQADQYAHVVKMGRTHLQDAVPITFGQELLTFAHQMENGLQAINQAVDLCRTLPIGGTAVGTGLNAHPQFASKMVGRLSEQLGEQLFACANPSQGSRMKQTQPPWALENYCLVENLWNSH